MGKVTIPDSLKVPDYKIYSYEEINKYPNLVKYQQELAAKGLKDPWLRNIFWVYSTNPRYKGGIRNYKIYGAFGQGFWAATAVFLVFAAIDQARLRLYGGGKKEDHGGHH